jgi:hypothetical protein
MSNSPFVLTLVKPAVPPENTSMMLSSKNPDRVVLIAVAPEKTLTIATPANVSLAVPAEKMSSSPPVSTVVPLTMPPETCTTPLSTVLNAAPPLRTLRVPPFNTSMSVLLPRAEATFRV